MQPQPQPYPPGIPPVAPVAPVAPVIAPQTVTSNNGEFDIEDHYWKIGLFFIVAIVLVLLAKKLLKKTDKQDVGGEHIKARSECRDVWINGMQVLPSEEEQNACGATWAVLSTPEQQLNAIDLRNTYNAQMESGGDMTQMVQNYSISTGATLSSNVSFNTQIALSY